MASTLVVEDGTGLANADSYLSSANADVYHTNWGNAAWAALTDAQKDAALRKATQYIDSQYRFKGSQLTYVPNSQGYWVASQRLQFPRNIECWPTINPLGGPWPINALTQATAELALKAATSGDLSTDFSNGDVIEEQVGSIFVMYNATGLAGQTYYTLVNNILRDLTMGSGTNSVRLERAE